MCYSCNYQVCRCHLSDRNGTQASLAERVSELEEQASRTREESSRKSGELTKFENAFYEFQREARERLELIGKLRAELSVALEAARVYRLREDDNVREISALKRENSKLQPRPSPSKTKRKPR